jgi:dihydroorotase
VPRRRDRATVIRTRAEPDLGEEALQRRVAEVDVDPAPRIGPRGVVRRAIRHTGPSRAKGNSLGPAGHGFFIGTGVGRPMPPPPVRRGRSEARDRDHASPALILAGRLLIRGRLESGEVAIGDDGTILSVGKVRSGAPRRDVGERVILPAATDLHVHFRDPGGSSDVETLASGTIGAALGGVGAVGEMPNTEPPVLDPDALADKAARVRGRSAVDVLLYAFAPARNAGPLSRSAGGFKLFLSPSTATSEVVPMDEVPARLAVVGDAGLPLVVHAEDAARFARDVTPLDPEGWNSVRPAAAERHAIDAMASPPPSLRLHVAHVSTGGSAAVLRDRAISFEASPHHLLLSDRSGADPRFKVNPPLRSEADRHELWTLFRQGRVPCLASDHAPHAAAEKARRFSEAPSGVPGTQTMLPLLLARVRAGELALDTLVRAACDRPARVLGLPVGRVAPGHRANLLVVDFRSRQHLQGRSLESPCGWTPFEGWEAIAPREHYREGERIVEDGEYVGRPTGRVVRPEYAPGPVRR